MTQRCRGFGLLVEAATVAAVVVSCGLGACKPAPAPPAGDVVADLGLPQLDGTLYDPTVLRGKKVLLNFWSPG